MVEDLGANFVLAYVIPRTDRAVADAYHFGAWRSEE